MHYLTLFKLVEVIGPFQLALTRVSSSYTIDAQEDIRVRPSPPYTASENVDFVCVLCK